MLGWNVYNALSVLQEINDHLNCGGSYRDPGMHERFIWLFHYLWSLTPNPPPHPAPTLPLLEDTMMEKPIIDTAALTQRLYFCRRGMNCVRVPVLAPSPYVPGLVDTVPVAFRDIELTPHIVDGRECLAAFDPDDDMLYVSEL